MPKSTHRTAMTLSCWRIRVTRAWCASITTASSKNSSKTAWPKLVPGRRRRMQQELPMNFDQLSSLRPDLAFIAHWVREQSQVLDIGCGDGVMLDYLQSDKQCSGYGVEIDDSKIPPCVSRGVSVIQQDLETGLALFSDNA